MPQRELPGDVDPNPKQVNDEMTRNGKDLHDRVP